MTHMLQAWLAQVHPTVNCHLGKQSGNMGRALARLPLLGHRLERAIHKKAKAAQTEQGPSLITAIGIYAFTLRRERRFQRMMKLRRAGNLIIADRFPQIEVPGPMDGPGLGNARPTGLAGWLARRELHKFAAMVAQRPDLVIRLNVSLDVAHARKPDHPSATLARKIADMARLTFQGAPIRELDADEPLDMVQAKAKAAIAELLSAEYGLDIPPPKAS